MSLTNADLAQQVTSLISRWDTYTKQLRDWLAGTPDGGPYGDGRYPLQNSLGQVFYVPCPAAQSAMVEGNAASAESFATQAAAHALAAAGAKAAAETARDLALTYRDAAQAAKALAETARNEAQTAEANARYWAEQAQVTAGGVNSVAADVAEAADAVAADRAAAEAARVAAEAAQVAAELAAQQAATFNPANYAPVNHTHAIADVTGLQAALDGKAAATHAHGIDQVTGLRAALDGKLSTAATAAAAAKLETPRTLQIGNTGRSFDGTTNVTWTLADIGAAAASHTHSASDITSGTLSDARLPSTMSGKTFTGDVMAPTLRAQAGGYSIGFYPRLGSGDYNPMVQTGDSALVYDAGANSGAFVIGQWSSTAKGLRIAADGVTTFSHTPTFPTASPGDNSTKGATTAFVQTALANKANSSHTHTIADVSGLQAALDGKAAATHAHGIDQVTGLRAALDGKAAATHAHGIDQVTGLQAALDARDVSALNQGGRLGPNSKIISNWDDAVENGYYTANNAANAPLNGWLMGRVVSRTSLWVEQEVWAFADDRTPQPRWVRVKRNGTWSAWNQWGARLWVEDTRYTMPQPNQFAGRVRHWDFKHRNDTGAGGRGWHTVLTVAPWVDYNYDHPQQQLVWRGDGLSYRSAVDGATWGPYKHLVTSPQAATEIFVQTADPGAVGAGKIWIKPV